jgi:hypothetical protein
VANVTSRPKVSLVRWSEAHMAPGV